MWTCPKCGENQEEQFDTCWSCQAERGNAPTQPNIVDKANVRAQAIMRKKAIIQDGFSEPVMSRYADAYLVARAIAGIGTVIKVTGLLLALVIIAGAAYAANYANSETKTLYDVAGFIIAIIIAALFYLFGTLVSAQGQILKASLDCAVNSSPFLSDEQRAGVMSLR